MSLFPSGESLLCCRHPNTQSSMRGRQGLWEELSASKTRLWSLLPAAQAGPWDPLAEGKGSPCKPGARALVLVPGAPLVPRTSSRSLNRSHTLQAQALGENLQKGSLMPHDRVTPLPTLALNLKPVPSRRAPEPEGRLPGPVAEQGACGDPGHESPLRSRERMHTAPLVACKYRPSQRPECGEPGAAGES